MDLTSSRTLDIAALALDGLSARHKAISSNIANADTPDYKRTDVSFEDQLGKIIQTEDLKDMIKLQNSINPQNNSGTLNTLNYMSGMPLSISHNKSSLQMSDFNPQTVESTDNDANENGNTVNIEREMSYLTKNGMTYDALANLQSKEFKIMTEVIKSQ